MIYRGSELLSVGFLFLALVAALVKLVLVNQDFPAYGCACRTSILVRWAPQW